jgi:glycosyltransferase involved in cell wall biosynthesis
MKISIITICYNSESTIEDTIKSVIAQDYDNVEYIIVDGLSKDSTMEIVERYKDGVATVISEKDKGIYDAMNKGVLAATGDIVGILNSDDFYADNTVLSAVAEKFESTGCETLYADLVYVDRTDTEKVTRRWISGAYKKGCFRKGWMPPHPTFFTTKEAYNTHGIYNTDLRTSADYELMLRFMHKHELKVSYLNKIITKMRVGGQSNVTFKNRLTANKEDRLAWKINGLKAAPFTFIRKPLSKVVQFIKK